MNQLLIFLFHTGDLHSLTSHALQEPSETSDRALTFKRQLIQVVFPAHKTVAKLHFVSDQASERGDFESQILLTAELLTGGFIGSLGF